MHEPTITPYFDADPCPRAEVLFTSLAAGTASVTVYRSAGGREHQMRGGVNADVAGALTRIDTEIPFGVEVSYRAEMFNSSGVSLGFTDSGTVTMHVYETWLHNPLDPHGAASVIMALGAAKSLSRPVDGETVHPLGRKVGVVVSGTRRGISDATLDCYTETDADTDKVAAMVGDYDSNTVPVLCFRIGASMKMRLPRPFFAAVLDPREEEADLYQGGQFMVWRMQGSEVAPPTPALFIPLLTRADINAFYATRAAVKANHLTRLSVNRAYNLIGAA
jgi:hypothetical protein